MIYVAETNLSSLREVTFVIIFLHFICFVNFLGILDACVNINFIICWQNYPFQVFADISGKIHHQILFALFSFSLFISEAVSAAPSSSSGPGL